MYRESVLSNCHCIILCKFIKYLKIKKKIANVMSTQETCILIYLYIAFMNPLLYLGQRHVIKKRWWKVLHLSNTGSFHRYIHAHIYLIAEETYKGKKQTNKDMSHQPGYTPCCTVMYTHKHTFKAVPLHETLSLSKAQQTVKDGTEWKGWENKKMEKQTVCLT